MNTFQKKPPEQIEAEARRLCTNVGIDPDEEYTYWSVCCPPVQKKNWEEFIRFLGGQYFETTVGMAWFA